METRARARTHSPPENSGAQVRRRPRHGPYNTERSDPGHSPVTSGHGRFGAWSVPCFPAADSVANCKSCQIQDQTRQTEHCEHSHQHLSEASEDQHCFRKIREVALSRVPIVPHPLMHRQRIATVPVDSLFTPAAQNPESTPKGWSNHVAAAAAAMRQNSRRRTSQYARRHPCSTCPRSAAKIPE